MKKKLTLVILAAGIGSRFGGLKQLESVGSCAEVLIDYSFYDAIAAGFERIVCVIQKNMQELFQHKITQKWESLVEIVYSYQQLELLPQGIDIAKNRKKPWGTAHAILVAADNVGDTPFAVINADDFYGRDSFHQLAKFLRNIPEKGTNYAMVAFVLKNTVSVNGFVSRGVCHLHNDDFLQNIVERKKIVVKNAKISYETNGQWQPLPENSPVSMNFWGFTPSIFPFLREGFRNFLEQMSKKPVAEQEEEYLIPTVIDDLIKSNTISIKVLFSNEKWMGMTYPGDIEVVRKNIAELVACGRYPGDLWGSIKC